jgi:hypothetical protein
LVPLGVDFTYFGGHWGRTSQGSEPGKFDKATIKYKVLIKPLFHKGFPDIHSKTGS